MKYHFKVHKAKEGGYWAECLELKGCGTQADTREELASSLSEALNAYLDEPEDSRLIMPLPRRGVKGREVVAVDVHPRVAFAFLLRRTRLLANLTQKQAAERLGITGSLNNYQRLENSKTANPELETLAKVKRAFPEFRIDQVVD